MWIVPDDQHVRSRACRSDGSRAALERRCFRRFRIGWLRRVSWQGLDGPSQQEAFQLRCLLALPSESESAPGSTSGRPGHSAVTGIVPRDVLGRVEDIGHEAGRLNANGPAELHALLNTAENRSREDVLGTLLPGSNGTTRLRFVTEDQPHEHVQTPEGEEEESGNEGEGVHMVRENCGSNPVVIQGQIRTLLIVGTQREARLTSTE